MSYLTDAGYADVEVPQKLQQWQDYRERAIDKGDFSRNHLFFQQPQSGFPKMSTEEVHPQKNRSGRHHEEGLHVEDRLIGRPSKSVFWKNEMQLYDAQRARRIANILPTQPVSFGELKPNHTLMGDLIVAFDKKLTLNETTKSGDKVQKWRYQYVVETENGVKELMTEEQCGGISVRKRLDETKIPVISGDFEQGILPGCETMHEIDCGLNWVTQPRAPGNDHPSKSSKAVCELWWSERDPRGLVVRKSVPLWRSHLLAKLGKTYGDRLCAKAFSNSEREFKTFWEVQECAFPWIIPPKEPKRLLLTDGRSSGRLTDGKNGTGELRRISHLRDGVQDWMDIE